MAERGSIFRLTPGEVSLAKTLFGEDLQAGKFDVISTQRQEAQVKVVVYQGRIITSGGTRYRAIDVAQAALFNRYTAQAEWDRRKRGGSR